MSDEVRLKGSEVKPGHCVILNEIERPCGRLVAVIGSIEGSIATCYYLNADPDLSWHNRLGMVIDLSDTLHCLTPVEQFGVEVRYSKTIGKFCCVKTRPTSAVYKNGKARFWQECNPAMYEARRDVLKFCKMEFVEVRSE